MDPGRLFVLLCQQNAEHRSPIAAYDLSHVDIDIHITPAGWEQAHDIGYSSFNLGDHKEMNWHIYQKAAKHPSMSKAASDDANSDSKEAIKSIADFIINELIQYEPHTCCVI